MSLDPTYVVLCPMPECDEALYLYWESDRTLAPDDLDSGDLGALRVDGANSQTWKVQCPAGHVLLIPGPSGCLCEDDQGGPNCPHVEADYDWSDDFREFTRHDRNRLRSVLALLRGEPEPLVPRGVS